MTVLPLYEPLESGNVSMIWVGEREVKSSTKPVGVPVPEVGLTVPLTLTPSPCVMLTAAPPLREKVVVVGRKAADVQLERRLPTLTEPSPVAKSKPAVVLNAGVTLFAWTKLPY